MKTKVLLLLAISAIIGYTIGSGATSVVKNSTQSKIELLNSL